LILKMGEGKAAAFPSFFRKAGNFCGDLKMRSMLRAAFGPIDDYDANQM